MSKPEKPSVHPYVNTEEERLTLLDYFAGQEMSRLAPPFDGSPDWAYKFTDAAKHNYDYAEAMLKEREGRMKNE